MSKQKFIDEEKLLNSIIKTLEDLGKAHYRGLIELAKKSNLSKRESIILKAKDLQNWEKNYKKIQELNSVVEDELRENREISATRETAFIQRDTVKRLMQQSVDIKGLLSSMQRLEMFKYASLDGKLSFLTHLHLEAITDYAYLAELLKLASEEIYAFDILNAIEDKFDFVKNGTDEQTKTNLKPILDILEIYKKQQDEAYENNKDNEKTK